MPYGTGSYGGGAGASLTVGPTTVTSSDTGSGAEGTPSLVVTLSSSDSGSGTSTESVSVTGASVSSSDAGTSADGQSLAASVASSDVGSSSTTTSITATLSASDSGSGAEGASVGFVLTAAKDAYATMQENVSLVLTASLTGVIYQHENATTDIPTPHIWYITPSSGNRGDVVEVIGTGFGPASTTYGGVVLLNSRSIYPTLWERLAPVSSGTEIDPAHNTADPEHDHVEFFIPSDAHSGDVQVMLTSG